MNKVICYVTKKGNISPCGTFAVRNNCPTNSYKITAKYDNQTGYIVNWDAEHINNYLEIGQTMFQFFLQH